jgi:hypothetical protein
VIEPAGIDERSHPGLFGSKKTGFTGKTGGERFAGDCLLRHPAMPLTPLPFSQPNYGRKTAILAR